MSILAGWLAGLGLRTEKVGEKRKKRLKETERRKCKEKEKMKGESGERKEEGEETQREEGKEKPMKAYMENCVSFAPARRADALL